MGPLAVVMVKVLFYFNISGFFFLFFFIFVRLFYNSKYHVHHKLPSISAILPIPHTVYYTYTLLFNTKYP